MKNMIRLASGATAAALLLGCTGCGGQKSPLDPKNPTTINVWNYYNGDQLAAFDSLVSKFNESVGAEKGIVVVSASQGDINSLADALIDAADGKAGAQDLPTLAAVYAETAYLLADQGMLVDMDAYFSAEELAAYMPSFIEEGRFVENGPLYEFPVSKSTEVFVINQTDWESFAAATGVSSDSIKTIEDLVAAAETYYNWTDSLTPEVPEDGKALYGRDSVSNYIYIGTKQLGHEMFSVKEDGVAVELDHDTFKRLWDNYYIPFINGYIGAAAKYRSEDMKTGSILSMTGSSSGISYISDSVIDENDVSHPITVQVREELRFADAPRPTAVQQGAGYCMLQSSEEQQYAAAEFLKWFTDADQNLDFSVASGYSPVKLEANDGERIREAIEQSEKPNSSAIDALQVSADIYKNMDTYAAKPFAQSRDMRSMLQDHLEQTCIADRAAVQQAIEAGKTRMEATQEFASDAYFEKWFEELNAKVAQLMG